MRQQLHGQAIRALIIGFLPHAQSLGSRFSARPQAELGLHFYMLYVNFCHPKRVVGERS